MSWSVYVKGKKSAVLAKVTEEFARAKQNTANIPHEQKTVELAEALVLSELNAPGVPFVSVEASGSAQWSQDDESRCSSQVSVKVDPLHGFVMD